MYKIRVRFKGSDSPREYVCAEDSTRYGGSSLFDLVYLLERSDSVIEYTVDNRSAESFGWTMDKWVMQFTWKDQ